MKNPVLSLCIFATLFILSLLCNNCTETDSTIGPRVESVTPPSGYGGDTIIIKGTFFGDTQSNAYVKINGVAATVYVSWSNTQIECKVPAGGNSGSVVVQKGGASSNQDVQFTRMRKWRTAVQIDNKLGYHVDRPKVSFDFQGNAFCVFRQHDENDDYDRIYAARYISLTDSWQTPVIIDHKAGSAAGYNCCHPEVTFDPAGNAFCVYEANKAAIFANHYNASTEKWDGAVQIDAMDGSTEAHAPQVAVDKNGNAICVFYQNNPSNKRIFANYYNAATKAWSGAQKINAGTYNAEGQQIAMDSTGNGMCVFYEKDSTDTYYRVFANQYDVASGSWKGAVQIDNPTWYRAERPRVTFDSADNAICIFKQENGTDDPNSNDYYRIFANKYNKATGIWEGPTIIDIGSAYYACSNEIAVDAKGNAIVVLKDNNNSSEKAYARYFNASAGWDTLAPAISTDTAEHLRIAMDHYSGNAIGVFAQSSRIYANIYNIASKTWIGEQIIDEGNNSLDHCACEIAIDPAGNAISVFEQNASPQYKIFANIYW